MSAELNIDSTVGDRAETATARPAAVTTADPPGDYGGSRAARAGPAVSSRAARALGAVALTIRQQEITAFIGPSGCGKTTVLRCFNRMNDLIDVARVEGKIRYHGVDLYDPQVNPVEVRRRIGVVVQKPNPLPRGT